MTGELRRLNMLKVRDVMAKGAICIAAGESMDQVAQALRERGISGLPVVNEDGRCIGIISAMDFVTRVTAGGAGAAGRSGGDTAESFMTRGAICVTPDSMMAEAARIMRDQHVHRLPVIDEQTRLLGVITSTDVVAAVVNAMDEAHQSEENVRSDQKRRAVS